MALMTWKNEYSVGVKQLDGQHMQLIDSLNKLHDGILAGATGEVTNRMLRRLMDYTNNHFATEEDLLAQAGYPQLTEHRAEHTALTRKVEDFAARHEEGEPDIHIELLDFLSDWLNTHILIEDKEYSRWLSKASPS